METAKFDRNTITITTEDGGTICKSSGSVLKFDGFLKVYLESKDDDDEEKEVPGAYNPAQYANLPVSQEVKDIFEYAVYAAGCVFGNL